MNQDKPEEKRSHTHTRLRPRPFCMYSRGVTVTNSMTFKNLSVSAHNSTSATLKFDDFSCLSHEIWPHEWFMRGKLMRQYKLGLVGGGNTGGRAAPG